MALGASPSQVLALVLRKSAQLGACGMAFGLPASIAGQHALASLLPGTQDSDPLILAAVCCGLLVMAAAMLPARAAARVDPVLALRQSARQKRLQRQAIGRAGPTAVMIGQN